jgi:hypothetical protein
MQHCIKFLAYDKVSNVRPNAFVLLPYPLTRSQLLMSTRAKETNLRRFSPGAISGAWADRHLPRATIDQPLPDAISVFFTYPSRCCACARLSTLSTVPPPAVPNDHPSSNQRALSTLKAAALRRIRHDLFHTLQLPKCCRGFRLLCQPRRHRTLRMGRFLTWDYLHAATPVTVSVSSDLQAALNVGEPDSESSRTTKAPFVPPPLLHADAPSKTTAVTLFDDRGTNEPCHRAHSRNNLRGARRRPHQHTASPRPTNARPTTRILRPRSTFHTRHQCALRLRGRLRCRSSVARSQTAAYCRGVSCATTSAYARVRSDW